MSRVGKLPIVCSPGVNVKIDGSLVVVRGPMGELTKNFGKLRHIKIDYSDGIIQVSVTSDEDAAMYGTVRSLINNMVQGVTVGFVKELEIEGVGYKAAVDGQYLNMQLGTSHGMKIEIEQGITVECPKPTAITIRGANKEQLGRFAANIIKLRPPEPYKGKGIRLRGQYVERKEGKKK